jgi:lipopolysaccharide/colanic/teichoic acid biosynthesis glycosyltransferase
MTAAAFDDTESGTTPPATVPFRPVPGLWQVSGRSDLSWDASIALDLRYVGQWTPGST